MHYLFNLNFATEKFTPNRLIDDQTRAEFLYIYTVKPINPANLKVWDAELMVGREVVCACGGCHHLVPCLLARLFSRCRDQPKLCHGYTGAGG